MEETTTVKGIDSSIRATRFPSGIDCAGCYNTVSISGVNRIPRMNFTMISQLSTIAAAMDYAE
jgi:hypothetical protein